MASANKSLYLDSISLTDIYARGPNNSTLPTDLLLLTNGEGGTVWQPIGSIAAGGAFTTINTSVSTFVSRASAPFLSIFNGPNAGLLLDPTAPNTLKMYANTFSQINLSGNLNGASTILSFKPGSNVFQSTLNIVASTNVTISANSDTNSIAFSSASDPNATVSTLTTLLTNLSTLNLSLASEISSFNSPYKAQPFIQYGSTVMNGSGLNQVSLSKAYTSIFYTVQLTYQYNLASIVQQPSFINNSPSTFTVRGDANRTLFWTTYGTIF
jgi:hypothetical protein